MEWPKNREHLERMIRRERMRAGACGFVLAFVFGALVLLALIAQPAKAQYTVAAEKPAIHQTADGTYTNDLERYPDAKPVELKRGYAMRAEKQPGVHRWSGHEPENLHSSGNLHSRSEDTRNGEDSEYCRDVFVGNSAKYGGVTVCGRERMEIDEQRVRRKGSLVTSTDVVIRVDGEEIGRVRGRRAQHDPGQTVKE
jgi:hypothetical protein